LRRSIARDEIQIVPKR